MVEKPPKKARMLLLFCCAFRLFTPLHSLESDCLLGFVCILKFKLLPGFIFAIFL